MFIAPEGWIQQRLAVGVALFITYFTHYLFLWLAYTGKTIPEPLEPIKTRIHTFGIACTILNIQNIYIYRSTLHELPIGVLIPMRILLVYTHHTRSTTSGNYQESL
jgi:hypothetical protein